MQGRRSLFFPPFCTAAVLVPFEAFETPLRQLAAAPAVPWGEVAAKAGRGRRLELLRWKRRESLKSLLPLPFRPKRLPREKALSPPHAECPPLNVRKFPLILSPFLHPRISNPSAAQGSGAAERPWLGVLGCMRFAATEAEVLLVFGVSATQPIRLPLS